MLLGLIIGAICGFIAGLLVGRNNPKIANKASEMADDALAGAKQRIDELKEKARQ